MARTADSMVTGSMTIYLDAGTTLQPMRTHLDAVEDLIVVTNDCQPCKRTPHGGSPP